MMMMICGGKVDANNNAYLQYVASIFVLDVA
jgi:hypothetical protein